MQSEPANRKSRRGQGQIWVDNLENTLMRSRGAIRRYQAAARRPTAPGAPLKMVRCKVVLDSWWDFREICHYYSGLYYSALYERYIIQIAANAGCFVNHRIDISRGIPPMLRVTILL